MRHHKMTDDEILNSYKETQKCLTLENRDERLPRFLEAFQFGEERIPDGHEALQGYMCGQQDILNELIGLMKKNPNISQDFKQSLFDLIRRNDKFYDEMRERWEAAEEDLEGYKGISVDMYDIS